MARLSRRQVKTSNEQDANATCRASRHVEELMRLRGELRIELPGFETYIFAEAVDKNPEGGEPPKRFVIGGNQKPRHALGRGLLHHVLDRDLVVPVGDAIRGLLQPPEAAREGLALKAEHWEVIRFLREHFERHGVQAQVRVMIRHFREVWGPDRGTNHHLHDLFPRGGPQKQGNRLAGLLKTKGEH